MCLTVTQDQKSKVAKEDIYTLKYLNVRGARFFAPIQHYEWKLGKLQKPVQLKKRKHSWREYSEIHDGYYSWDMNKMRPNELLYKEIFLCMIPKGTRYYQDMSNEQVCAAQMIVVEQVYSSSDDNSRIKDNINVNRMSYKQRLAYIKHMCRSYGLNTQL